MSPRRNRHEIVWNVGLRSVKGAHRRYLALSRAKETSSRASLRFTAMGFSTSTCLPDFNADFAIVACPGIGVSNTTASTSGRHNTLLKSVTKSAEGQDVRALSR